MEGKETLQGRLADKGSSAVRKYRGIMTGDRSLWYFMKFELVTFLLGYVPGALGLFLRKVFYPSLFRSVGRGVVIGRNVSLRHPHKISLGENVYVDEGCLLDAQGADEMGLVVGSDVIISRNSMLICKYGSIHIGDRANFGSNCLIGSMGRIEVGADTLFAANCYVGGGMYRMDRTDIPVAKQGSYTRGPIVIGEGCWLGAAAVVADGVRLGRHVVMGAGAVAVKDLPDYAVAVGVPARVLRVRGESGS